MSTRPTPTTSDQPPQKEGRLKAVLAAGMANKPATAPCKMAWGMMDWPAEYSEEQMERIHEVPIRLEDGSVLVRRGLRGKEKLRRREIYNDRSMKVQVDFYDGERGDERLIRKEFYKYFVVAGQTVQTILREFYDGPRNLEYLTGKQLPSGEVQFFKKGATAPFRSNFPDGRVVDY